MDFGHVISPIQPGTYFIVASVNDAKYGLCTAIGNRNEGGKPTPETKRDHVSRYVYADGGGKYWEKWEVKLTSSGKVKIISLGSQKNTEGTGWALCGRHPNCKRNDSSDWAVTHEHAHWQMEWNVLKQPSGNYKIMATNMTDTPDKWALAALAGPGHAGTTENEGSIRVCLHGPPHDDFEWTFEKC